MQLLDTPATSCEPRPYRRAEPAYSPIYQPDCVPKWNFSVVINASDPNTRQIIVKLIDGIDGSFTMIRPGVRFSFVGYFDHKQSDVIRNVTGV